MRKINKITYTLTIMILLLLFIFSSLLGGGTATSFAATSASDTVSAYEEQNVLTDLSNSTIAGEKFDLSNYPFDETLTPQIIQFVEFGYGMRATQQDDYGLYLYVYNPQGLVIDTRSTRNQIQIAFGDLSYSKYELAFLNYSTASGFEGLFYKFKISITDRMLQEILKTLSQNSRIYKVSGIELSVGGQVTEYTVALEYTYTGYAKGYGSELMTESTLSCYVDGMEKYVELDVHHTTYRPQGDYYEGKQSQLNSCYFRVPDEYFTSFGNLNRIACQWYEYMTKPILVTQDNYLYQRLYNLHGASVDNFSEDMYFVICSLSNNDTSWFGPRTHGLGWASNCDMKEEYHLFGHGSITDALDASIRFDNFAAVFYSGNNTSYRDRYVSSEELTEQLLNNSEILGEPYFNERYSEELFDEYVNPDHIRGYNYKEVEESELVDIFWNITTKDFWQTIFGGYDVDTVYDSAKAIVTITDDDLSGSNAEIASRLYVSEGDVDSIKAEFAKCNKERLVLFRYASSEYYSIPSVSAYCTKSTNEADVEIAKDLLKDWRDSNYTAYIAQETVFLDFDIIKLWFISDGVETEIPVISSPTDVIAGLDSPLIEDYHNGSSGCNGDMWSLILTLILTVLLLVLLAPFLPVIINVVVWIVMLPFRLIGAVFKGFKKDKKRKKE